MIDNIINVIIGNIINLFIKLIIYMYIIIKSFQKNKFWELIITNMTYFYFTLPLPTVLSFSLVNKLGVVM